MSNKKITLAMKLRKNSVSYLQLVLHIIYLLWAHMTTCRTWGSVVVKALRYWSGGPRIDSRWCHWGFFPWYPPQNHVP